MACLLTGKSISLLELHPVFFRNKICKSKEITSFLHTYTIHSMQIQIIFFASKGNSLESRNLFNCLYCSRKVSMSLYKALYTYNCNSWLSYICKYYSYKRNSRQQKVELLSYQSVKLRTLHFITSMIWPLQNFLLYQNYNVTFLFKFILSVWHCSFPFLEIHVPCTNYNNLN